jgi:hypothetical protein
MSKLLAGALIAAAVMAGIYAAASTIATAMAASFTTAETSGHVRIVEFAAAVEQASAEHKAARTRCELLTGAENDICNAVARAQQKRDRTVARVIYQDSITPPADAGADDPETARDADVALYRVHRQLSD